MAWRSWFLDVEHACLLSTVHRANSCWLGPVSHADLLPTERNTNGLYAVRDLAGAPVTSCWGQVALSGVVVEAEFGYRAETATIRSLFVAFERRMAEPDGYHPLGTWEEWPPEALVQALEERYKVDVVVAAPPRYDKKEAIASNWLGVMSQHQYYNVLQSSVVRQAQILSLGTQIHNAIGTPLGGNI